MKSITKRIMESTIVMALLISGAIVWFEKKTEERIRENIPAAFKMYNKALWDKYGPGNRIAYIDLFVQPQGDYNNIWLNSPFVEYKPRNFECGLAAVQEAPDWFYTNLDLFKEFPKQLHQTLEVGPAITALEESGFFELDESLAEVYCRTLRYMALRDWLQGNREKAISQLIDLIRLGYAFRYSPAYLEQYTLRDVATRSGLDGLDSLIWKNLDASSTQTILKALRTVQPESWSIPFCCNNGIWTFPQVENAPSAPIFVFLTTAYLLGRIPHTDSKETLNQIGIYGYKDEDIVISRIKNWTTLPAMNKRLRKLPESFYEDDYLLSSEQAKSIPPLLYACAKVSKNFVKDVEEYWEKPASTEQRQQNPVVQSKVEVQALEAALWCRKWREERGAWPAPEEFKTQYPSGESFQLLKINTPLPLLLGFQRLFEKQSLNYDSSDNLDFNPLEVSYPYPNTLTFTFAHHVEERNKLNLEEKERIEWTLGIYQAFSPLVKTATYTIADFPNEMFRTGDSPATIMYQVTSPPALTAIDAIAGVSSERNDFEIVRTIPIDGYRYNSIINYTIELNAPQNSYWIAEYDDESISPDEFLIENLPTPKKDNRRYYHIRPAIQLAGWE